MYKSKLPWVLGTTFFLLLSIIFIWNAPYANAQTSNHIVISEVKIGPASSDFIELYNPTAQSINLRSYRLVKRTSTGASDSGIIVFKATDNIPAHGFSLWCNSSKVITPVCDSSTSATLAFNNSIALRNGAIDTGAIIDAVTLGTVTNPLGEGIPISIIPNGEESFERKATSTSTIENMTTGTEQFWGNGEDTDNNINDFILRNIPNPQNSNSELEFPDTATTTPSVTITETPTETITMTPTETVTPTPTITDTPTPTVTPSPTQTITPTITPSPTVPALTETPPPTSNPTPTATPLPFQIPHFQLICTTRILTITIPFFNINKLISIPSCNLIKL